MSTAPSDEQLVAAFQSGDVTAFDGLVRRWESKIRGAIYRVLGSEDEARDLAQEAFLKAYRALPGFKGQAKFSSWLYQIALNLCRDRLRRRRGRPDVSLDALREEGAADSPDRGPSPLELAQTWDLSRRVADAVAALPPEQREVLVLKEYQELTFAEIAEVLDIPLSTVKTRLYRGLDQVRRRLAELGVTGPSPVPAPRAPQGDAPWTA
jgi:RNA polymerase sigma-70 factor (ECF subfamily)